MSAAELAGPRVRLRGWRPDDREPFAAVNADLRVMEHFPAPLTRAESDALIGRIEAHFATHGFGRWAVDAPRDADGAPTFVGFVGLAVPAFEAPFTPCVEIGWRLAAWSHGQGFATEAARLVVGHAFGTLGLRELVSFTVPANRASIRVMEKIGMRRDVDGDFDHPALPDGHRLRRHVLYRLRAGDA